MAVSHKDIHAPRSKGHIDSNNVDFVLDAYKAGVLEKTKAISGLTQMIAALDLDNYDEVRSWLEQGRKLIHMLWTK